MKASLRIIRYSKLLTQRKVQLKQHHFSSMFSAGELGKYQFFTALRCNSLKEKPETELSCDMLHKFFSWTSFNVGHGGSVVGSVPLHPEGHRFESHSSRRIGTWVSPSLAVACSTLAC